MFLAMLFQLTSILAPAPSATPVVADSVFTVTLPAVIACMQAENATHAKSQSFKDDIAVTKFGDGRREYWFTWNEGAGLLIRLRADGGYAPDTLRSMRILPVTGLLISGVERLSSDLQSIRKELVAPTEASSVFPPIGIEFQSYWQEQYRVAILAAKRRLLDP